MTLALLAAALLAGQGPDDPMTAGRLYDGCVRYAARAIGSANSGDEREIACEARAAGTMMRATAEAVTEEASGVRPGTRIFCLPESTSEEEEERPVGYLVAKAFITYVDAHPVARSEHADLVFERALAETWPCPR